MPKKPTLSPNLRRSTLIILTLGALLLSGCGSKQLGDAFSQSKIPVHSELGTAVFYRPDQSIFMSAGFRWPLAIDNERVAAVGEDTYTVVQMPAGPHQFNTLTNVVDTTENVEIKAGKIHYFKVHIVGYSFWRYVLIEEKPEQEAMQEISVMREQINAEPWIKKIIPNRNGENRT